MDDDLIRRTDCVLTELGQGKLASFLASGYETWGDYIAWAERPENHEVHLQRVGCARSAIAGALDYLERLPPRPGVVEPSQGALRGRA